MATKTFVASKQQSRFLAYVVDETLSGRADQLKELALAIDVFGRDASFDPRLDSIVRVEASRLRTRLSDYYRTQGRQDPVVIGIPKGRYVPEFEYRQKNGRLDSGVAEKPKRRSLLYRTGAVAVVLAASVASLLLGRFLGDSDVPTPSEFSAQPRPTIAVLPFANRSSDPDDAFFVDGIHEDLLTRLARIGSWTVIAKSSVERFRDATASMAEIGASLGATNIIGGSVQRSGDRVRISVQLIDTSSESYLWAGTYDRELTTANIFAVQSEIAEIVAKELLTSPSQEEVSRLDVVPTESLPAYESYLRGRLRMADAPSGDSATEAQRRYEHAIELDPTFAEAYAGLADSYFVQMYLGTLGDEAVPAMAAAVDKALQLDSELGEAHAALGNLRQRQSEYPAAAAAFSRAIELSPNSASIHYWYSRLLANLDRFDEALVVARRAAVLDPESGRVKAWVARCLTAVGRFDEALTEYQDVLATYPTHPGASLGTAAIYWTAQGRLDQAAAWYMRAIVANSENPLAFGLAGLLFLDLGDEVRAERLVSEGLRLGPDGIWANWHMQTLRLYLGDENASIEAGLNAISAARWLRFETPALVAPMLANSYLRSGRYAAARALFEEYFPELLDNDDPIVTRSNYSMAVALASLLRRTGDDGQADVLLDRSLALIQRLPRFGSYGYGITDVQIYALQARNELALETLRAVIDEGWRYLWWYWLEHDASLDGLRDDPAFGAMTDQLQNEMATLLARLDSDGTFNTYPERIGKFISGVTVSP